MHDVTGRAQNHHGSVEILTLEVTVEGIGEEHDLARLVVVRALANLAAGIIVGKTGTVPITQETFSTAAARRLDP